MKVELWNGYAIRWVDDKGDWISVAQDICEALDIINTADALKNMPDRYIAKIYIPHPQSPKKKLEVIGLNELGIYRLIMRSNKPEALAFQDWVFNMLKSLREALGYEQYRMMAFTDSVKNHRLNMDLLKEALNPQDKVPYIKAQTIANKCMATIVGEPKAISKDELKEKYPEMIPLRDEVLTSTAELMALNERFNLGVSVNEAVYRKYQAASYTGGAV